MSAALSPLQLDANRANALLSTGPKTAEGKLASSRNAQSHGLTTRHALLPGEDLDEYQLHHSAYLERYRPQDSIDRDLVVELADIAWRLRRVPSLEAELQSAEFRRLKTDPELTPLIKGMTADSEILALAFRRLVENRVLPNLLNLETRLTRRADKLHRRLDLSREAHSEAMLQAYIAPPVPFRTQTANPQNEPGPAATPRPIHAHKPGRNQTCPCGSGLKSKRCCWR